MWVLAKLLILPPTGVMTHSQLKLTFSIVRSTPWYLFNKQACAAGCRRRPCPAKAPPIDKIHPFSKMAVTFEPMMGFLCSLGFGKFLITMT